MWQQLSGSDKSRFVCYVIGLPAAVLALILFAMGHQWVRAAISAFLVFGLSYSLYKLSHGKGEPPPRTINPGTAQAAEKTDTTTTNVRCHNCEHVQAVPRSQPTFTCEQCKAHLKRRGAPAKSSE
jgi:ribosomal protein S27E